LEIFKYYVHIESNHAEFVAFKFFFLSIGIEPFGPWPLFQFLIPTHNR
jgi:hypothetical protein